MQIAFIHQMAGETDRLALQGKPHLSDLCVSVANLKTSYCLQFLVG